MKLEFHCLWWALCGTLLTEMPYANQYQDFPSLNLKFSSKLSESIIFCL